MWQSLLVPCLLLAQGATTKALTNAATGVADITTIAAALQRQDQAWDDLDVRYVCEWSSLDHEGQWRFTKRIQYHWVITKAGWEQFSIYRPGTGSKPGYVETLSFNGEYFMTRSTQGNGSGTVGHEWNRLINHPDHIKKLGLAVAGLELNQPLSVAAFLTWKAANARIERFENGLVVVKGDDPFADEHQIWLWLDPAAGYRPRVIEFSDQKGLMARIEQIKYERFSATRGEFWFPVEGTWNTVRWDTRAVEGRCHYRVLQVSIDKKPNRDAFTLTFPKGTLLVNTDTQEAGYLETDSGVQDIPHMKGKLISLTEADARLRPQNWESPLTVWVVLAAMNVGLLAVVGVLLFLRRKRAET